MHRSRTSRRDSLESRLRKAVNNGDTRTVQTLLSQGVRADVVDSTGVAAIHLVVGKETEKITRCLKLMLQHGADPNVRSEDGLTPLHVAALYGCYQNLKLLLMNGGNPNTKDQDGNTPRQLAESMQKFKPDNRKCAQLLHEYQSSSPDAEEEEMPQFQYSLYSGTDTTSCQESDCSTSSRLSIISDFGEAALSSTRRSSMFDLSAHSGAPWSRESGRLHDARSMLSSTRMSVVDVESALSMRQKDVLFDDISALPSEAAEVRFSRPSVSALPAPRKSVSFRGVDEFFPVFASPESPKPQPAAEADGSPTRDFTFDLSEYSGFLDSERMVTILPQRQGIDVTSPDHVYVFRTQGSDNSEEDLEKTVISLSSSSHYSSCESDHYTTTLEGPQNHRPSPPPGPKVDERDVSRSAGIESDDDETHIFPPGPEVDERDASRSAGIESDDDETHIFPPGPEVDERDVSRSAGIESDDDETHIFPHADSAFRWQGGNVSHADTRTNLEEVVSDLINKLVLSDQTVPSDEAQVCPQGGSSVHAASQEDTCTSPSASVPAAAPEDDFEMSFTPSPFVTGRSRSRQSRTASESLLLSSTSLFEQTLPTPVRSSRRTPRSQSGSDNVFYSPPGGRYTPQSAGNVERLTFDEEEEETQCSTLGAGSSVGDTLIISGSQNVDDTQTLSHTVVLENKDDSSTTDDYEKHHQGIIMAMRAEANGRDFLTDDLTSTDDAATSRGAKCLPDSDGSAGSLKRPNAWMTDNCGSSSQSSASLYSSSSQSSSGSSCFYSPPGRSQGDIDPPCTPGTGCTPRYSMSRLSVGHRRPSHTHNLSSLSYTPGGRPHLLDLEQPVEYLYTDSERGLELIETHIPSSSNTSVCSSSDETVLYDWRSMQAEVARSKGKENRQPPKVKVVAEEEELPAAVRGLTDRDLRRRLLDLGESPGPITGRTRPTYTRRLGRLLLEGSSQSPERLLDTSQKGVEEYSVELRRAMQTLSLLDCHGDELALSQEFDQPDANRKWREGIIKSSFNYLLLDPRVTNNLPFRSRTMTPQERFQTFIGAIFYVGKGKRSRPYSHLYEALEYHRGDKTSKKLCTKVQHILQVWSGGHGVVSLHCFQNVIPVEAYTREACMVDALGLKMLTNKKRGDFYGVVSTWQARRRRQLGVHLLYKAMQIFLAEGERQLRPADIRQ